MVVKVTETKTVADSLWQGYNVRTTFSISQNVSQFSEKNIRVTTWKQQIHSRFLCFLHVAKILNFDMSTFLRCLATFSLSTGINLGKCKKSQNFSNAAQSQCVFNSILFQYTDELTPHVEWLEDKKTLANRWILCSLNVLDLRGFPSIPADIWLANTPNLAYNQTMLPLFFSSICWWSSFSSPYFVTSTPVHLIINLKFSGTSTATVLGRLRSILRGRKR